MTVGSAIDEDIETGKLMTPSMQNQNSSLLDPALVLTASVKRIDQAGKMKYVKQVVGRYNDMELHLAAYRGDLASVKHILDEITSQMVGNLSGAEFDAEVSKIRASVMNEVIALGETALYTAAKKGHLEVVKELLKYSDKETLTRRSRSKFDPLHVAASQGHRAIVKLLLDHDVSLCQTRSKGNATPLITAASKGHTAVVHELLSKDPSLLSSPVLNGRKALHLAARSGHAEIVKSLLEKDPQLARRTDKMGQTALHMAVEGASSEVVKLLLCLPDTNVNALTKDYKTALDIAEWLFPSEQSADIRACLAHHGAVRASELIQPRDELRSTMTQIKSDVHAIGKNVRKLHRQGNNQTNCVTMAIVLAAIALAAIFMVPGGYNDDGMAVVIDLTSFKIFYLFNAMALYTSLAVVVIHMTLGIRGEKKAKKRQVVEVINKFLWVACVCTSVAFMASSYIVVGRKHEWVAVAITVLGGAIMLVVVGSIIGHVGEWKIMRSLGRLEKTAKKMDKFKQKLEAFKYEMI
ncbi:putative ankyrin repeat-containing domain, PGG domain, ankyrin repeat-containing domain superfamily [Helianthus debilis subsp. tardiflorus]